MSTLSLFFKFAFALGVSAALLLPHTLANARTARDAAVDDSRIMCERYGGGKLRFESGFETKLDFNGDGLTDTLLDMTKLKCDGAENFQPLGCSEYGCSLIIYVSSRRTSWTMSFSANDVAGPIYNWKIISSANRRPEVQLTMGGAACKPLKAQACTQSLSWDVASSLAKLSKVVMSSMQDAKTADARVPDKQAAALPLDGGGSNNVSAIWSADHTAEGFTVARVEIGGSVQRILLLCNAGIPEMHVAFKPRPENGPLALNFTRGGQSATVALKPNAQTGHWTSVSVNTYVMDLLNGPSDGVYMTMNGEDLGPLSLKGSSAALRQSLGKCYSHTNSAQPMIAATPKSGFTINVRLTPRAANRLAAAGHRIEVMAYFSATPKRSTPERLLDEVTGELILGEESVILGPQGGAAIFTTKPFKKELMKYAESSAVVLVNAFTDRAASANNTLNCGILSLAMTSLSGTKTIDCDLI